MTSTESNPTTLIDESQYRDGGYAARRKVEFPREDERWRRIHQLSGSLDVITLDVIEWALEAAIDESEAAVERTARSTIIREQHDYRASVSTVDCNSVTHVSWAATADPIRVYYGLDDIAEGDIFLYNDIHESYGTIGHLPDYCVVIPVFSGGELLAFAQIFGHCNDVGSRVAGSWPLHSTSIYEEGVMCPPIKLYARGQLNDDAWKILKRNSRFPDDLQGDIDAFVGAARIMERRVRELCERYGADTVEAAFYGIIDRCRVIVREEMLPQLPDGDYVGEDFVENDGIDRETPVKVQITLRKDAEKIIIDCSGTDPQTKGPINWTADGRQVSKWLGGFVKAQVPGIIVNEGMVDVLRTYAPPRTVVSAEFPAPGVDRLNTMQRMLSAYTVAMAKVTRGNMIADAQCIQIYGFFGSGPGGEFFLYREIFGAGSGARPFADGTDTVDMVPNSKNLPAEFIEQRFPVLIKRVGLFPDSGGPGAFRGGLGYLKDVVPLVDCEFLTISYRTVFACFGVNGGMAGRPGRAIVNPGAPHERVVVHSQEAVPVKAGEVVRILTPGGGGWGDPLARVSEAVRLDVMRGIVSESQARQDYGVVVERVDDPGRVYVVNEPATRDLRAELRAGRPPLKMINRGEYAERLITEGRITVSDPDMPAEFDEQAYLRAYEQLA